MNTARRTNRRLQARHACQLTVRYRTGKEWHPATAMDVSPAGCRLRLGEDLHRGLDMHVVFETPNRANAKTVHVEAEGSIIWSRLEGLSHQAGVQFGSEPNRIQELLSAIP